MNQTDLTFSLFIQNLFFSQSAFSLSLSLFSFTHALTHSYIVIAEVVVLSLSSMLSRFSLSLPPFQIKFMLTHRTRPLSLTLSPFSTFASFIHLSLPFSLTLTHSFSVALLPSQFSSLHLSNKYHFSLSLSLIRFSLKGKEGRMLLKWRKKRQLTQQSIFSLVVIILDTFSLGRHFFVFFDSLHHKFDASLSLTKLLQDGFIRAKRKNGSVLS